MADTALSAGEFPAQRREHLPRQQPQQPLRPAELAEHAGVGARPVAARPLDGRDHAGAQTHLRAQPKTSYLRQRASGTANERVFNARDSSATGAPVPAPTAVAASTVAAAAVPGAGREARLSAGGERPRHSAAASEAGHQYRGSSGGGGSSRRMVGPYQLAKTIGAGSMGKVKVALDTRTNKRVAAKIIPLQQPDAPIYFPSALDTTTHAAAAAHNGPVDTNVAPWRSWLTNLALESHPDVAAAIGQPVHIQRKLRLLQPRERYTTKDRERRENKDIRIVREVAINRLLHHPHICMLHDVVVHPNHYYIFQELVSGGQMLDYIISHGRLKEKHARKFARQIASAIDYCHHNSIVHRDLKIENILISANGNIKLIDFGLSNLYSPRSQLSTFCGSLYFAAPELLNAQPYIGPEVDLWSYGVVLYVLVCGKVPFDDQSMPALHAKIKRGNVEYPAWLSPECRHLLSRLLVVNPLRRATMGEVTRHPWMSKGYTDHPLINSYLPSRTPLVSPEQIDRDVVREMAQYIGFGFGSEEEIRVGLEAILTEDWYRSWVKDKLAPHLEALRTQLYDRASRAANAAASTTEPLAPAPATRAPYPGLDLSSGATLAGPGSDAAAASDPALEDGAAQGPLQNAGAAPAKATDSKPSTASDSVRKRSSFWKRSSTFISGGLTRAAQKANADPASAPANQTSAAAPAAAEKHQLGQLRALSGRVFGDGKHSSSPGADGHSRTDFLGPLHATHTPRMFMDQASGMVSIWKDGKLAPPDTECGVIQQEYHDIIATDPLLAIYFLVKERRERETRHALHYPSAISAGQIRPATRGQKTHPADAAPAGDPQPAAAGNVRGLAESNEAWIKLERIPEKAPVPEKRPTGPPAQTVAPKAPQDASSALASSGSAHRLRSAASSSTPQTSELPATSQNEAAHTTSDAVDQTTAAIEALSLRPRSRGSGLLASKHAGGTSSSTGFQDSRKKRSSIFKRFSVIVKGARTGSKPASAHAEPNSRIVQAEGKESGYMEISVHKDQADHNSDYGAGGDKPNEAAASVQKQHSSPLHLINAESIGSRLRGNTSTQKYTALNSIEEDKEYTAGAPGSGSGSQLHKNDASPKAAASSSQDLADSATSSLPSASGERQYLDKPFCAKSSDADSATTTGASSAAHKLNPILVKDDDASSVPVAQSAAAPSPQGSTPGKRGPATCADNSPHSSEDLDGESSMFTSTDIEDDAATAGAKAGGSPSEKAALLERARREIEGLDEQEGVGLLDQTPELNYRAIGQFAKPSVDSKGRRARSSSNTVVRMLTDIVRDASGAGSNTGGASTRGARALHNPPANSQHRHNAKAVSPKQAASTKTIPRHSSTGAINRAGGKSGLNDGSFDARESPDAESLAESLGVGRPDILRSHSHTIGHQQRGRVLPSQLAEVPESPARDSPTSTNPLGTETAVADTSSPLPTAAPQAADSKCGDLSETSIRRGRECPAQKHGGSSDQAGLASSPEPVSPATADGGMNTTEDDIMDGINSAPPRADEHLKPVFLKGLFSVSTTSTRSPTVIRANLMSVLGDMPVRFHEGKGYFTCSMATTGGPTNIQEDMLDAYARDELAESKNSSLHKQKRPLRLPVVDRKISFRRRSKRMDEATQALTAAGEKPHGQDGMSSNDDDRSESPQSEAESAGGAARTLQQQQQQQRPRRSSSSNAICFQIFMVRMPLLGLYGLQFRRVSGPAWKYKDICSEILRRLKL